MKDNRSNIKVSRITRDRLMSIKYVLRCKSMDITQSNDGNYNFIDVET